MVAPEWEWGLSSTERECWAVSLISSKGGDVVQSYCSRIRLPEQSVCLGAGEQTAECVKAGKSGKAGERGSQYKGGAKTQPNEGEDLVARIWARRRRSRLAARC